MRNLTGTLVAGAVAGALSVGALGGVALARQAGNAQAGGAQTSEARTGVPYELLSADSAADEAAGLAKDPKDHPRLRAALRRGLIGVHGEATVRARGGGYATYAWQRGEVTAASASSVTVKSADGTSWTWALTTDTKVRKNGAKSASSALTSGDGVFVLGRPDGDARTAQGVVVPKKTRN
ncbi:hypothetical protein ABZU32_36945 [Sphaerisporangium sp. NPDC005288]|uniref:hypothetical protein n=1 Tax=Sphaerisporangium sp. NPDC005288 TaxID=3155114 RepID=UPI0033BABE4E